MLALIISSGNHRIVGKLTHIHYERIFMHVPLHYLLSGLVFRNIALSTR